MKISKILIAATLIMMFAGCKKSLTDNLATGGTGLQFQLRATNLTANLNRTTAATIEWTSGFANADLIKVEAKNNNKEVEFKNRNPQKIDVFAPVASSLGNITIPPGDYTEVEFKIDLDPAGNDPALQLTGQFTNGRVVMPVVFSVNDNVEIKGEQNNITITSTSSTTALTTLDLALLSSGITQAMLSNASLTNGSIIISNSSNKNLFDIILNNLNQSHEVEVDHH